MRTQWPSPPFRSALVALAALPMAATAAPLDREALLGGSPIPVDPSALDAAVAATPAASGGSPSEGAVVLEIADESGPTGDALRLPATSLGVESDPLVGPPDALDPSLAFPDLGLASQAAGQAEGRASEARSAERALPLPESEGLVLLLVGALALVFLKRPMR